MNQEQNNKDMNTAISWYPGHMEKARRQMQESLKAVDMIIEVRDARMPLASANPLLQKMTAAKPRLIILAKSDLADPAATEKWIQYFQNEETACISADLLHDASFRKKAIQASLELTSASREKMKAKGMRPRAARAMAAGIPNVGKSTLINRISGRNSAKAADKPGVTRSLLWIHADPTLDIMDTPGVLWPKFEDQKTAVMLAAAGTIKDTLLDTKVIAETAIHIIRDLYQDVLEKEYGAAGNETDMQILELSAIKRNLKREGGEADIERASMQFLLELRRGRLGRFTLEMPHA